MATLKKMVRKFLIPMVVMLCPNPFCKSLPNPLYEITGFSKIDQLFG